MGTVTLFDHMTLSVDEIKNKYNQTYFVETGCYHGDSILFMALKGYKKIFSCDMSAECVEKSYSLLQEFNFTDKIELNIVNTQSIDFLNTIVPMLPKSESIFFFLDAHLPHMYDYTDGNPLTKEYTLTDITFKEQFQINFPLEKELDIIHLHRQGCNDYIVCDDARIYLDSDFGCGKWKDKKLFYNHDEINFDFLKKYQSEYDYTISFDQEGYLILTNKEK